ncbi:tubby C-terminal domain-like protein [Neobacillus rhizophilus]|uniref:Tubby C-terminal domain-containing protein n=1 Tax=Neobacillus rhizophilus TaxID=2833579 RepID=A0A942YU51_9BACI|nr:hypothetical protein [Neobacillus rhizophilus]MBS4212804.1 hypothetical protein [Neobacillus rhizophilus]
MQKYTYSPPKIKDSTKLVDVLNQHGNVVCRFKRTYKSNLTRIVSYIWNIDWHVQIDVYSNDRDLVYQCKKTTKWVGHPYYQVFNCKTNEVFQITYKTWQKIAPEFLIISQSHEFTMKKEVMDWVRFYHQGKEVARWKMKTTEMFKTYLEIEEDCPIQDPEFFVCLLQNIFFIGD